MMYAISWNIVDLPRDQFECDGISIGGLSLILVIESDIFLCKESKILEICIAFEIGISPRCIVTSTSGCKEFSHHHQAGDEYHLFLHNSLLGHFVVTPSEMTSVLVMVAKYSNIMMTSHVAHEQRDKRAKNAKQ